MWSEVIEQVRYKFNQLQNQGWDAFVDEDASHQEKITQLYETLTWEMVEGITGLFLEMVQNLNYARKKIHISEPRTYEDIHVSIIGKLEESIQPEITTIPQFYLPVKSAINDLHAYCRFLSFDIQSSYRSSRSMRMDRKTRQMYLVLKELIDGFRRVNQQAQLLLHAVGDEQMEFSLQQAISDPEGLQKLLDETTFSESEKEFLAKAIRNKKGDSPK